MNVTPLNLRYRGFELGYAVGLHGYRAAWRSSMEDAWHIGHLYLSRLDDIYELCCDCIDYNYRVEAKELELGRPLTAAELPKGTE